MNGSKTMGALSRGILVLAATAMGCVVEVDPNVRVGGTGVVFSDNFDSGGGRWTLGDGYRVETANGSDLWLRAQYDDTCTDQSYNFAYVTEPFNFTGATSVTVNVGAQGQYGTRDTTGLAWTTDTPGPGAVWNELAAIVPSRNSFTTGSANLPSTAFRSGVYLGIYFRNICIRNSLGVDVGYDDFKVVVTR